MSETQNQPWKLCWPPTAMACTAPVTANAVCAGKGAQPHETSFADGTNVMRLDNIDDFMIELDARREMK